MDRNLFSPPLRRSGKEMENVPTSDDAMASIHTPSGLPLCPLHLAAGDLWAGAEVQIYELLRALLAKGLSPEAALFNDGQLADKLRSVGIQVHLLLEQELGPFRLLLAMRRLLRRKRFDLLHTHGLKANVLGGLAATLAGVPSLRTVHSRPGGGLVMQIDHLSARYLQRAVVSVSNELTPFLNIRYGEKVHEIENGLDVTELSAMAGRKKEDGLIHVGFVGRLVPIKRVDLFLEAAAQLHQRSPGRYLFHLYGDGPERKHAQTMIEELGLADCARMEGFHSPLAAKVAQLHLLVMPSDHEGLPMAMLEALALGVPVVAHAVGGMVRVLEVTKGGELVRSHTAEGYAVAIEGLMEKLRADAEFSERALQRLKSHYDVSRTAGEYVDLYRTILGSPS